MSIWGAVARDYEKVQRRSYVYLKEGELMENKIIGIFIDALRPGFISEANTPFLYALSKENPCMVLETILGYSDAIDATILTGTYPDIYGYWMKYYYDPQNSPFKNMPFLSVFKLIDYIPSVFIRSGINFVLCNTFYKWFSRKLGYNELASYNIPYKFIHNFDFTLKKSLFLDKEPFKDIPTIVDILDANGKTFYYTHGIKSNTFEKLEGVDLGIVYLNNIDFTAHLFGLKSPRFSNALKKVDEKVKTIFETCKKFNPNTNIIVFSDHGMADVHTILTFKELFKDKRLGTRYLFALDGTKVRFWYFDDGIKNEIHELFKDKTYGHFLTDDEKKEFRIKFDHNLYGDDIFLLDQGYSIFPNFMSWAKPKAMHAYHPKYKEQKGTLILHGGAFRNVDKSIDGTLVKLVDIMPTVLDVLELEIPDTVEGRSLVGKDD